MTNLSSILISKKGPLINGIFSKRIIASASAKLIGDNINNSSKQIDEQKNSLLRKSSNHPNIAIGHQSFMNLCGQSVNIDLGQRFEKLLINSNIEDFVQLELPVIEMESKNIQIIYIPSLTLLSYRVKLQDN